MSPWAEVCGIAVSMLEGDQSVPTGAIPERSSRGGRGKEERGDNGSCERTSQEKGLRVEEENGVSGRGAGEGTLLVVGRVRGGSFEGGG